MVLERKTALQDASRVMKDSYQHAKRVKRKLVSKEARRFVDGNRGRPSPRALNDPIAQRIIALSPENIDKNPLL